jgi:hypothetical protein
MTYVFGHLLFIQTIKKLSRNIRILTGPPMLTEILAGFEPAIYLSVMAIAPPLTLEQNSMAETRSAECFLVCWC